MEWSHEADKRIYLTLSSGLHGEPNAATTRRAGSTHHKEGVSNSAKRNYELNMFSRFGDRLATNIARRSCW